jgi:hypothetical protein
LQFFLDISEVKKKRMNLREMNNTMLRGVFVYARDDVKGG